MMIRTGKRMTECQEYLYILHGVTFTKKHAQDKSVLFQLTAWSENNQ
ncbi:hypothetical protein HNQ44_002895 [Planomicrobium koreense]|jgi:hypothetical protein|uniref:Uncharacterized protein n=1 Tax=Planococcus koreensis TaxID=112331 RepID=A0A7W8CWU4_9BACL|nr:hypothetical protein [Planococcus koreensis]